MAAPPGRRQSTRQVSRTSRPTNYYARNFAGRNMADGPSTSNDAAQPGFFPAIQHFTDAVDALPKEVIRHFSMLREVESKLHGPDELIRHYANAITNLPDSARTCTHTRARQPPQAYFPSLSAHNSVDGSRHGSVLGSDGTHAMNDNAEADRERQSLFYHLTMNIAMMAPALDEKIAVLSTANQTLRGQLDRMISSYHHLPDEISEEARLGNPKHWAYVTEKETKKVPERPSRREIVSTNTLAAAAAALEGEFASRSEARREAVAARKGRAQQVDSDFDDRPPPKKGPGKAKKPVPIEDPKSVGLGIANGIVGPGKRKKVPGGVPIERSASGATSILGRGNQASPRDTPDVVPKKRAKPGPAPKKTRIPGGASPHMAASPIVGTFAAKEPAARPAQARGRQNSAATPILGVNLGTTKPTRPPSSQSNKPTNSDRTLSAYEQLQATVAEAERAEALKALPGEARLMKSEEADNAHDDVSMLDVDVPAPPPQAPTVTRAGRTSKTATPLSSNFPIEPARRAARTTKENNSSNGTNTASHASSESGSRGRKKAGTAGVESTATSIRADVSDLADEENREGEEGEEEDGEGNEGEPKYCYCNDVSYGEMVACDNERCEREWFHLKCAGLTKAPDENTKWYCDDCKVSMGQSAKRSRPVSRRAE